MTFTTHGGPADSGRKFRLAVDAERKADWSCPGCGLRMRGYLIRCLTIGCNKKRTEGGGLCRTGS